MLSIVNGNDLLSVRRQKPQSAKKGLAVMLTLILLTVAIQHVNARSFYFFFAPEDVRGKVLNELGAPMPDVSVTISGKSKGTVTDPTGSFKIQASETDILVFTYVGYESKRVVLKKEKGLSAIEVHMSLSIQSNEVVVIGVQRQIKRTSVASVTTVLGKDIENLPSPSVDALLQGRVAGLNVQIGSGEPGATPTVVVRGNSTVSKAIGDPNTTEARAMSSPLYVIDGVPVNPSDLSNSLSTTGTNFLAGINVNDIENVVVQKDAIATAAWGSQGANGVIYITTRKGRSKTPEFRVNIYGGVISVPPLLPTLTGAAERRAKLDLINQYATSPAQKALIPQILTDSLNPFYNNATDWQGLFYRSGFIKNMDASVSAAADNFNYRVSMNYYDEKSIIQAFGLQRYSLRGSFNFKLNPKMNSQLVIGLSRTDKMRGMKFNGSDNNTPISGADQPSSFYRVTGFDSSSFSGRYDKLRNKNINDLYSASFTLNYNVLRNLQYTFQGSANINTANRDYFKPSNIDQVAANAPGAPSQPSAVSSDKSSFSTYFVSNTLNYSKNFVTATGRRHDLAFTAGQQFTRQIINSNYVGGTNTASNNVQVVAGVPQANIYGGSSYQADALLSYIGQMQYSYERKYSLYASYRTDASSRFGSDTKWGSFGAVGGSWVVSDENFMKKGIDKVISLFKLRASYGISGNRSSDFYAPYNSYTIPGSYGGSTVIQPDYNNGLTKNNLTWAKTEQKNIAADIEMFNGKVNLTVEAYDRLSKDDYYDFQLPFYTGFSSIQFNARDLWVSNRGIEITLGASLLPSKSKLQWRSQLTIAHNKNAIAKLPNNNRTFVVGDPYGVSRIYSVGQPIYEMFQVIYAGVYNNKNEIPFNPVTGAPITYFKGGHTVVPGDPRWLDINKIGDVWPDEDNGNKYGDRTPSGDPNPKFTGGWVNDFSYKNFAVSITSVFTWKRDIVNTYRQQQFDNFGGSIGNFVNNRLPDLSGIDYWTPAKAAKDPNYQANFPSLSPFGGYYYQFFPFTTMWNEDGSYFKIKSIMGSYMFPKSVISKIKLAGARIYGVVDNVLTIKNSSMANPELVDQLGNYTGGGYPTPTKFTIGIDIQF
ncbi:MAG: SusC/RagA family TonB-linked outer membrane protein [Bacteroidota bacterium]